MSFFKVRSQLMLRLFCVAFIFHNIENSVIFTCYVIYLSLFVAPFCDILVELENIWLIAVKPKQSFLFLINLKLLYVGAKNPAVLYVWN